MGTLTESTENNVLIALKGESSVEQDHKPLIVSQAEKTFPAVSTSIKRYEYEEQIALLICTISQIAEKKSALELSTANGKNTSWTMNQSTDNCKKLKEANSINQLKSQKKTVELEMNTSKTKERHKKIKPNNGLTYFEVAVLATMSAGKSTLVNALIGRELLPASNEACTARIFKIENDDFKDDFVASIVDINHNQKTDWIEACPETLIRLNKNNEKGPINIVGNIRSIKTTNIELVIYDTPGPNNSQDKTHGEITKEILHDGKFGLVFYVINATQFGVEDDAKLLTELFGYVENDLENKEVIFILNKADQIDESLGESIANLVTKAEAYLGRLGFKTAKVFPVSAMAALLARKSLNGQMLTRKENRILNELIIQGKEAEKNLYEHSNLTTAEKNEIKSDTLATAENLDFCMLIEYSGITAVEHYLKKKLKLI